MRASTLASWSFLLACVAQLAASSRAQAWAACSGPGLTCDSGFCILVDASPLCVPTDCATLSEATLRDRCFGAGPISTDAWLAGDCDDDGLSNGVDPRVCTPVQVVGVDPDTFSVSCQPATVIAGSESCSSGTARGDVLSVGGPVVVACASTPIPFAPFAFCCALPADCPLLPGAGVPRCVHFSTTPDAQVGACTYNGAAFVPDVDRTCEQPMPHLATSCFGGLVGYTSWAESGDCDSQPYCAYEPNRSDPEVCTACPPPGVDAGVDAGTDAGRDGGVDSGVDSGLATGLDGGVDSGLALDAALEPTTDAGEDAGEAAAIDAASTDRDDAGPLDAGSGIPSDAGSGLDAPDLDAAPPPPASFSGSGCRCAILGTHERGDARGIGLGLALLVLALARVRARRR
ncbi:MAG: hypothetical protein U0353_11110 [Sandaracinus sp.]